MRLMHDIRQSFSRARAIVLAAPAVARWEDELREAGALHFVASPRRLDIVARLAERHLANVHRPKQNLRETIWSRLPWSEELRVES